MHHITRRNKRYKTLPDSRSTVLDKTEHAFSDIQCLFHFEGDRQHNVIFAELSSLARFSTQARFFQ